MRLNAVVVHRGRGPGLRAATVMTLGGLATVGVGFLVSQTAESLGPSIFYAPGVLAAMIVAGVLLGSFGLWRTLEMVGIVPVLVAFTGGGSVWIGSPVRMITGRAVRVEVESVEQLALIAQPIPDMGNEATKPESHQWQMAVGEQRFHVATVWAPVTDAHCKQFANWVERHTSR